MSNKDSKIDQQYKALNFLINRKASAGLGEDGSAAALTYLEILKDILSADFMTGTLYEKCWKVNVSEKANGILLPAANQLSRSVDGGILGGIITYPIEEGVDITPSIPKFTQTSLPINQVAVFCRATNALVQDSTVLPQYLRKGFEDAVRMRLDHSIIYGNGANTCYGVAGTTTIGTRATKKVTLANPITVANIKSMMNAYYGGKNGCWIVAKDAWNEIFDLYSNSTNPILPLHFTEDQDGRTKAVLYGFPIYVADYMKSRDIVLGDFSAYIVDQKSLREDFSEHLYWNSNETAFRSIIRFNGCPIWSGPITEQNGAKTYCFVASLHADTDESSSSSSMDVSESSSSSSKSLSSGSSGSNSSGSSQSLSSDSSGSNSSDSSISSPSSGSESSSQSSGAHGPCADAYTASTFATAAINGVYQLSGRYNTKPYYAKTGKFLWFHSGLNVWVISNTLGSAPAGWLTNSVDESGNCPDGAYTDEAGLIS